MSAVPRISFEDLPSDLRDLLSARVERLGYLGEFFQVAAHQREALAHFVGFTEALKDELPSRLVEIVALTVAGETGNAYERVQHERLALANGMPARDIASILSGEVDSDRFDETDRLASRLARNAVRRAGRGSGEDVARLTELHGAALAVGLVLLTGRYVAHSAAANAWELDPPATSPEAANANGNGSR